LASVDWDLQCALGQLADECEVNRQIGAWPAVMPTSHHINYSEEAAEAEGGVLDSTVDLCSSLHLWS